MLLGVAEDMASRFFTTEYRAWEHRIALGRLAQGTKKTGFPALFAPVSKAENYSQAP
jgi:hypothetical protein